MKPYIVSFFGNKEVSDCKFVLKELVSQLESLLLGGDLKVLLKYPVFYCGGYGRFSQIASDAIDILRKQNPDLELKKLFITPYITPSYLKIKKYMKEFYDEIVYPPLENVPPRFAIARRNQWMIDQSDLVIAYMENPCGNTRKYVNYAFRKAKPVIFIDSIRTESKPHICR